MRTLAGIALCFVMCCSGCGPSGPVKPKVYPVSGKVTSAGKPLTDCTIIFTTSNPQPGVNGFEGDLNAAGEYTLHESGKPTEMGAAAGKYKIVFRLGADAAKKAMMGPPGAGGPPAAASPAFPPAYNSAGTSPKEVEVKAESNTINIEI